MPPPRIGEYWQERVYAFVADAREKRRRVPSARSIEITLHSEWERLSADQRKACGSPPKQTKIRDFINSFGDLKGEEKAQYESVRWPESFGSPDLPWEASRAILDLLAELHRRGFPRPLPRNAKWFWRVTQLAPDLGQGYRFQLANRLALLEARGELFRASETRRVEWYLAFRSWQGTIPMSAYFEELWKSKIRLEGLKRRYGESRHPEPIPEVIERFDFSVDRTTYTDDEIEISFGLPMPDELEDLEEHIRILEFEAKYNDKREPIVRDPEAEKAWTESVQAGKFFFEQLAKLREQPKKIRRKGKTDGKTQS